MMLIEITTFFHDLWLMWSHAFSVIPFGNPYLAMASPIILMSFVISEMISRHNYLALKRTYRKTHAGDRKPNRLGVRH